MQIKSVLSLRAFTLSRRLRSYMNPQELPTGDCSHCAIYKEECSRYWRRKVERIKPQQDRANEFFHVECHECSQKYDPGSRLCPFCRHSRLRHMTFCVPHAPDATSGWVQFFRPSKYQWYATCQLCSLIAWTCNMKFSDLSRLERLSFFRRNNGASSSISGWMIYFGGVVRSSEEFLVRNIEFGAPPGSLRPLLVHDWDLIKRWLERCSKRHNCIQSRDTASLASDLPADFRLIDIAKRRVIQPTETVRFVALSYVWGRNPDETLLQATKSSIQDLGQVDGLEPSRMPRTVEDAMAACTRLSERYLWVDRLCIIQDDADTKRRQIDAMDKIFASASVVIVAASFFDMNSGLRGISHTRNVHKQVAFDGITVTQLLEPHSATVRRCYWDSRAWTYQEAVLAKRTLYFGREQVCFECQEEILHEDIHTALCNDRTKADDDSMFSFTQLKPGERRACAFNRHVFFYFQRELTNSSDIINAFRGMLNRLYPNGNHHYGLPLPSFDEALLLSDETTPKVGRVKPRSEGVILPTWSWSSFSWGRLEARGTGIGDYQGSLIRAFRVSEESPYHLQDILATEDPLVWVPEKAQPEYYDRVAIPRVFPQKLSPRIYLALTLSLGCIESKVAPSSWNGAPFADLDDILKCRWPSYEYFWREIFGTTERLSDLDEQTSANFRPGVLYFRAQTAILRVGKRLNLDSFGYQYIQTSDGENIGWVGCRSSHYHQHERSFSESGENDCEFVAISLSAVRSALFDSDLFDFRQNKGIFVVPRDSDDEILDPVPTVNALLIRREGALAFRVAVAHIPLTYWVEVRDPQFRTVLLA